MAHFENRAVSAFFRLLGEKQASPCCADAFEESTFPGMHEGERVFLGIFVPFSLWVILAAELSRWLGWGGWLLSFPATFIGLNFLPYLLNARVPLWQWRSYLFVFTGWATAHLAMERGGWSEPLAWAWLIFFGLNFLAGSALLLDHTFTWSGRKGIVWRAGLIVVMHVGAILLGWHWAWYWGCAAGMFITLFYCGTVLHPGSQFLGPVRRRMEGSRVLITIDDGPDSRDTPVLLDLLDRYERKAIFFLIGEKVAAHPDLAREIYRRGHTIGNHTMSHPQASFWCSTPARTQREIVECQEIIKKVTGMAPRWFRAPVGHRNWFTHPVTWEKGLEVMGWNRRGYDAVEKDPDKVLEKILPGLQAGDIVLLHEATPIAAAVLEGVLEKCDELGI